MEAFFLTSFFEVILLLMWAALWVLVIAMFIWLFQDAFRRRDLSGWGKAGWILLVFVFPVLGALIYIAARPKYEAADPYLGWAPAKGTMSPAEEVAYAHALLEQGTITPEEFEDIKRRTI